MKREGRQHGVVTSYPIPPPSLSRQRFIKMVDSAASTMGVFAKVPTKPTNRSKFTGKCRKPRCNGCHLHPVCKSKGKAKGSMKVRSMDSENELAKYSFGTSATGVLAYLADGGRYDNNSDNDDDNDNSHDFGYDYDYEDRVEENYSTSYGYDYDDYSSGRNVVSNDDNSTMDVVDMRVGFGIGIVVTSVVADDKDDYDVGKTDDDDDDETMSFCDVGLCWGHEDEGEEEDDEGGWYLVGF